MRAFLSCFPYSTILILIITTFFINVIDNGPGIPESIQSHLFEPFVTSKYGGSGLGLSIVSSIVEEHGGIIEVKSDKTTIFTVLFPALEEVKR